MLTYQPPQRAGSFGITGGQLKSMRSRPQPRRRESLGKAPIWTRCCDAGALGCVTDLTTLGTVSDKSVRVGAMRQVLRVAATIGGVLAWAVLGLLLIPASQATPGDEDANFLTEAYQYAHPQVSPQFLVQLGHEACAVRRAGGDSGDAKVAISKTLWAQGFDATGAEVGSLVHAAVDTLCPEVGYP